MDSQSHIESEVVQVSSIELEVAQILTIDEAFGIYAVEDYNVRLWDKCYYALRNTQGFHLKRKLGDEFNWDSFNFKFAEIFGTPTDRKASLQELLDYALCKFNMTQENLVASNNRSWEMRREREARENREAMRYANGNNRNAGNGGNGGFKPFYPQSQQPFPKAPFTLVSDIDLDSIPY